MTAIRLGTALAALIVPLAAAAAESRYTDLVGRSCKFEPIGTGLGDDEYQTKRCPGLGSAIVKTSSEHTQVALGFEWPRTRPVDGVLRNWSIGTRMEWRGTAGPKGFEPYAATVRVLFPKDGGPNTERQLLAIMRVTRGQACVVGVVDIVANPNAYDLARRVADGKARAADCRSVQPTVEGAPSTWTADLLSRLPKRGERSGG